MDHAKTLLAIVEFGGYPDFRPLYARLGYEVAVAKSARNALRALKKGVPDAVVAEFNFQSDFRDRTSNLESILAVLQRHPNTRVVVFYDAEYAHQFERLKATAPMVVGLPFPVDEGELERALNRSIKPGSSSM